MPFALQASIAESRAFENDAAAASATQRISTDEANAPRPWRFGARAAPAATKRRKRPEIPRNRSALAVAKRHVDIRQSWRISTGYDRGKVAIPGGDVSEHTLVKSRVAN